jgi:hypothetical protein
MKSILEELWYGNICPETGSRTNTPEMKRLIEYMARHHGSILTTINNGQKQRKNLTAWPSSFFIGLSDKSLYSPFFSILNKEIVSQFLDFVLAQRI